MLIQTKTILGLDVGTNSIGWALLETQGEKLLSITDTGVRIFPEGVAKDNKGKETPLNQERRLARNMRRLTQRKAGRMKHLLLTLQENNLLPHGNLFDLEGSLAILMREDPYLLRKKALYEPLELHFLGRVIYHLAQHRGFLSNRKNTSKDEEEKGAMKTSFLQTEETMEEMHALTYGEFLANVNPHEQRRRGQYILRQWIENEYEEIWSRQCIYYPEILTPKLREHIKRIIFYQRPLKPVNHLIGNCQLESHRKRAPMAFPEAQILRMLQIVNDTLIQYKGQTRELTEQERSILIEKLLLKNLKFNDARKLLKLPKGSSFNMENGTQKYFLGVSTVPKFIKIFGDKWDTLSSQDRSQIFEDWWSYTNEEALIRRMQKKWELPLEKAQNFASLELESGYSAFSRKALSKLIPLLKKGFSLQTSITKVYGGKGYQIGTNKLLPAENIRNPIVQRALSEIRKVVNNLIKEYGKPEIIRIELARDLKQNTAQRQEIFKKQEQRRKQREKIAHKITQEIGIENPSGRYIEKALLHEECKGICPYTGKSISYNDLLGAHPLFDIEHIIPFSRCLDNSFNNKTLCFVDENRNKKKDHTPWEIYSHDVEKWQEIIQRVEKFGNFEKLRRFKLKDVFNGGDDSAWEEFTSQQLNDTRYITRFATRYLNQLYDSDGKKHVQPIKSGKITAFLRNAWGLNNILGNGIKNRNDHRHHAIDAIVIGLTSTSAIKSLSIASQKSFRPGSFNPDSFPQPCNNFLNKTKKSIDKIIVSHRGSYKINGTLHKEKMYGFIKSNTKDKTVNAVIRKPIEDLSTNEVEKIVDPVVKKAVEERLKELACKEPKKAFAAKENHPFLLSKDGSQTLIHKVRVFQNVNPKTIGQEKNKRNVLTSNNHHLELYLSKNNSGKETFQGKVATNLEMVQSLAKLKKYNSRQSLYPFHDEKGNPLAMVLFKGDMVKVTLNGKDVICVILSISNGDIEMRLHNDARINSDRKHERIRFRSYTTLYNANIKKLTVSPAGFIRE
ncbi:MULTISPECIES: type II CRISPR RNA-guided endonuclease Cas9 [Aminobacterium]|uniref:type II CRISPR RNA-guided endonuclease Cas9 n=1 Tax=Aminobacterium TaxID=81466 RepID=UPI00257C60FE|nr:type II CRISPR RNA-guided endonuclease Cas9 [Aminobacterium sp. UBA4834]